MVTAEDLLKDDMYWEAKERMELMEMNPDDIRILFLGREITKVYVDHVNKRVRRQEPTEEEIQIVKKFEQEYGVIVYYLIQDEALWPDGCTFPRYTLLYVDQNKEEYEMVKEECITSCGTVPAYIMNLEIPECSEFAEIAFHNVGGLIINAS